MEFRFNVNEVFKQPIVEITNTLIPPDYTGNRRMLTDTVSKVAEVVNELGIASAKAQGLSRPLTSGDKLKNSEHSVYLAVDDQANYGRGAVAGLLKIGKKSLYVFDRQGREFKVTAPFLFDFYVPENKQRMGWGKYLYDSMLLKRDIEPVQVAFDQPTNSLLNFLDKHYGMKDPVKQATNFVVYDGFFPNKEVHITPQVEYSDDEDERHPVGKCRVKPKYTLEFPDEDEEEMYRSKNLLA